VSPSPKPEAATTLVSERDEEEDILAEIGDRDTEEEPDDELEEVA